MTTRPTAIVADDSKTFLMYFSTLLNRMNFDVLPVQDGAEAFDLARVVNPNIISLDVLMPGQCGVETLRQIRGDEKLARTPVVMVSGSETREEECRDIGCCDYLTKPIDLKRLHAAMQRCQPNREGQRKHLRAPFNRQVSYQAEGERQNSFAITLSEGGIYLRTPKPLPVGTRVEIDLPLSHKETMLVCGEVIYNKGLPSGRFMIPPGMAVRFDEPEPAVQDRLSEEVKHLLVGDMVEEQAEPVFRLD